SKNPKPNQTPPTPPQKQPKTPNQTTTNPTKKPPHQTTKKPQNKTRKQNRKLLQKVAQNGWNIAAEAPEAAAALEKARTNPGLKG
ncbi:hypothetical protein LXA21_17920, partial [Erwinia amylovora]|nr:hypothetical protein [Erwinia amylovora]